MSNWEVDGIFDWVSLVFFELIVSSLALVCIAISVYLFANNHIFWGIVFILFAVFWIISLYAGVRDYVRDKE